MPFEQRWMTGVWGPITYDPELDMAFYGSSGVGPAADVQRGVKGDATLAGTNTRYAINPATGKIVWEHQVLPQDNWDQECTFEMMPIATRVAPDPKAEGMMAMARKQTPAPRKTLTGVPCKTSIMWSFDEAKGDFLWAKSTVYQNLVNGIDAKGKVTVNPDQLLTDLHKVYHQCPTHSGGRDWPFAAYSPDTNVMYVQLQNLCTDYKVRADNIPSKPRDQYNTSGTPMWPTARPISAGWTPYRWRPARPCGIGKRRRPTIRRCWRRRAGCCSTAPWTAGFAPSTRRTARCCGRPAGFAGVRRAGDLSCCGTAVSRGGAAGGGYNTVSPQLRPDLDQVSGGNMVYVFALPE